MKPSAVNLQVCKGTFLTSDMRSFYLPIGLFRLSLHVGGKLPCLVLLCQISMRRDMRGHYIALMKNLLQSSYLKGCEPSWTFPLGKKKRGWKVKNIR